MKALFAFSFLLIVSTAALAQDSTKLINDTPSFYMTMKKGKLIEYNGNRHRVITQDRTLTDGTTVHSDGSIDLGSGQSHQLKRSEYLTMDGQIRKMKNMAKKKKGEMGSELDPKAIAHPARIAIIQLLAKSSNCANYRL